MRTKTLHFKVNGEGITNLIRQLYLYEDKQKAWNIIGTMSGITVDQANDIFKGYSKFVNDKDDDTILNLVKETDMSWNKEFNKHLIMLEERELKSKYVNDLAEELMFKLNISLRKEEAVYWINQALIKSHEYTSSEGIINRASRLMKEAKLYEVTSFKSEEESKLKNLHEEMQQEANKQLAKKMFIQSFIDKDKSETSKNMINKLQNKIYSFVFDGHKYTFDDSARNQGECPHCGLKAPDGHFWQHTDKEYIGYYSFGQGEVAVCFECSKCFKKFYYHYDEKYLKRRLKNEN